MKTTYLIDTRSSATRNTSDRMPKIFTGVIGTGCVPAKTSFMAYSGWCDVAVNDTQGRQGKDRAVDFFAACSIRPLIYF